MCLSAHMQKLDPPPVGARIEAIGTPIDQRLAV